MDSREMAGPAQPFNVFCLGVISSGSSSRGETRCSKNVPLHGEGQDGTPARMLAGKEGHSSGTFLPTSQCIQGTPAMFPKICLCK